MRISMFTLPNLLRSFSWIHVYMNFNRFILSELWLFSFLVINLCSDTIDLQMHFHTLTLQNCCTFSYVQVRIYIYLHDSWSCRWPYSFLDLSSPFAPLWYVCIWIWIWICDTIIICHIHLQLPIYVSQIKYNLWLNTGSNIVKSNTINPL